MKKSVYYGVILLINLGLYAFKWPLEPQDRPHHVDDIIHGLLAGRYRKHNF